MEYVVYHVGSTVEFARYVRRHAAAKFVDKLNERYNWQLGTNGVQYFDFTTVDLYNTEIVKTVTVKNLMTGEAVEVASNTPACCDPSRESYWSM